VEEVLDQRIITRLSLALSLKDDFTKREEVLGSVKVTLPQPKLKATENPSGYHNFLDLANGTHSVRIESDYYLEEEIDLTVPSVPPQVILLKPSPLYPFPHGTTLIRGGVRDSVGNPVPEAEIKGDGLITRTTSKGEFVLYFQAAEPERTILIQAKKGALTGSAVKWIEKGKTVSVTITIS
jgi:hypothetical protein